MTTYSPKFGSLAKLGADDKGNGRIWVNSSKGKALVELRDTGDGYGGVRTFSPEGQTLVALMGTSAGGIRQYVCDHLCP